MRLGSVSTESGQTLLVAIPTCAKQHLLAFSPTSVASVTIDVADD